MGSSDRRSDTIQVEEWWREDVRLFCGQGFRLKIWDNIPQDLDDIYRVLYTFVRMRMRMICQWSCQLKALDPSMFVLGIHEDLLTDFRPLAPSSRMRLREISLKTCNSNWSKQILMMDDVENHMYMSVIEVTNMKKLHMNEANELTQT